MNSDSEFTVRDWSSDLCSSYLGPLDNKAALIRASDTWRRVVISEFELKQLTQLREHLERRHDERVAPIVKNASRSRISSNVRT